MLVEIFLLGTSVLNGHGNYRDSSIGYGDECHTNIQIAQAVSAGNLFDSFKDENFSPKIPYIDKAGKYNVRALSIHDAFWNDGWSGKPPEKSAVSEMLLRPHYISRCRASGSSDRFDRSLSMSNPIIRIGRIGISKDGKSAIVFVLEAGNNSKSNALFFASLVYRGKQWMITSRKTLSVY